MWSLFGLSGRVPSDLILAFFDFSLVLLLLLPLLSLDRKKPFLGLNTVPSTGADFCLLIIVVVVVVVVAHSLSLLPLTSLSSLNLNPSLTLLLWLFYIFCICALCCDIEEKVISYTSRRCERARVCVWVCHSVFVWPRTLRCAFCLFKENLPFHFSRTNHIQLTCFYCNQKRPVKGTLVISFLVGSPEFKRLIQIVVWIG